ncbi:hypothetical protein [Nocardiopsis sp. NPDC006938]|uniref:hypothetical protein n=1 Tax=Nocardiopsis sp. NPDC006938 TaxID=3364337 RepID=UPI0036827647
MTNTDLGTAALFLLILPAGTVLAGGLLLDSWVAGGLAGFFVFLLGIAFAQVLDLGTSAGQEEN